MLALADANLVGLWGWTSQPSGGSGSLDGERR